MKKTTVLACVLYLAGASVAAAEAPAQADPDNVPQPPVDRLAELDSFLGTYQHTDQEWMGVGPFDGTLEVAPAVKGWYVEWVIDTRHRTIDRENRMIMTWDDGMGHYRVWRFETTPQLPPGVVEGTATFRGDTLVMEWEDVPGPRGGTGTFRNRAFMDGPDELVIISDVQPTGGTGWIRLGEWRNQRTG